MPRMRDERGAVGVVVAILMVPLIGFAAVSIDVAAMYAERQQLQTGADAGALAIAQDCGRGACTASAGTAQTFATSNLQHASSTATVTALSATQVTVRNTGVKQHLFAPVLGIDSSTITASATAAWGSPIGGHRQAAAGRLLVRMAGADRRRIALRHDGPGDLVPDQVRHRLRRPIRQTDSGRVRLARDRRRYVPDHKRDLRPRGAPRWGNSLRPADAAGRFWSPYQGKTLILPVFDDYGGAGRHAWYQVHGYAAFTITGYYFAGQYNSGQSVQRKRSLHQGLLHPPRRPEHHLRLRHDCPTLGASIVRLTQ